VSAPKSIYRDCSGYELFSLRQLGFSPCLCSCYRHMARHADGKWCLLRPPPCTPHSLKLHWSQTVPSDTETILLQPVCTITIIMQHLSLSLSLCNLRCSISTSAFETFCDIPFFTSRCAYAWFSAFFWRIFLLRSLRKRERERDLIVC
jgi:hypothetical protein